MPTVLSVLVPTCCAMFSTRLVFPIDGRAAMMTRSEGCRPDVRASRSVKPGRHAREEPLVLLQLLDRVEAALHELAQRHEAGLDPTFGNLENRPFGLVELHIGVRLGFVGRGEDLVGGVDQIPEGRLLLHDTRVVLDVGRVRHAVDETSNVGRATHLIQVARAPEFLLQSDEIDDLTALAQANHLVEDPAMRVAVEVAGVDQLGREVEGLVTDEDGAEHALLGFQIVWERALRDSGFGHGRRVRPRRGP